MRSLDIIESFERSNMILSKVTKCTGISQVKVTAMKQAQSFYLTCASANLRISPYMNLHGLLRGILSTQSIMVPSIFKDRAETGATSYACDGHCDRRKQTATVIGSLPVRRTECANLGRDSLSDHRPSRLSKIRSFALHYSAFSSSSERYSHRYERLMLCSP